MEEQLLLMAEDIASTRGLQFSYKEIDRTSPTPVPTPLTSLLEEECRKTRPFQLDASQRSRA